MKANTKTILTAVLAGAAVLLLLGTLAAALDFPALTRYGTFRKLEEQYLLTPSRLVYRLDAPGGGAAFLTRGEGWYTVGKVLSIGSGGEALTNHYAAITQVLPADRPQVVLLPHQGGEGETAAAIRRNTPLLSYVAWERIQAAMLFPAPQEHCSP